MVECYGACGVGACILVINVTFAGRSGLRSGFENESQRTFEFL